jgi:hypothetical protein
MAFRWNQCDGYLRIDGTKVDDVDSPHVGPLDPLQDFLVQIQGLGELKRASSAPSSMLTHA